VSNEYDGLGWNNFYSLDGINFSNGYRAGMASGPNVAYNGSGNPDTINSPSPFNLLSLDLAAAWLDGMAVTIDAYNGSSLAYSTTVYPSATAATLYTLTSSHRFHLVPPENAKVTSTSKFRLLLKSVKPGRGQSCSARCLLPSTPHDASANSVSDSARRNVLCNSIIYN
jgi:hypothetical protein